MFFDETPIARGELCIVSVPDNAVELSSVKTFTNILRVVIRIVRFCCCAQSTEKLPCDRHDVFPKRVFYFPCDLDGEILVAKINAAVHRYLPDVV